MTVQPGHHHGHRPHTGDRHSRASDARYLAVALAILLAFLIAEVVVALAAGSLALLADAAHLLTDAGAIAAALVAARLAGRPARGPWTFGFKRAEILSAAANGVTLVVVGGLVLMEAIRRLAHPPPVSGAALIEVALAGVAVNVAVTWALSRADRTRLNVAGAFAHVLTDLYAFLATVAAGVVVVTTGWRRADPVASLLVVLLMARAAWQLLAASGRVLLEAAPAGTEVASLTAALRAHPEVASVHDVHLWTITSGFPALSAHVLTRPDADCHAVRRHLEAVLGRDYGIAHTTLQVDHARGVADHRPGRPPARWRTAWRSAPSTPS